MATFTTHTLRWFLFAALLGLTTANSVAQQLPKGWRLPTPKETRENFRRKDPNRFLIAIGDFNGDGIKDRAMLLVNDANSKLGLFVCLKTANGCHWRAVEEMDVAFLSGMGIAAVKPGKYKTACGKGYWDCAKDEPETLVLRHEAIEFFKDESASSYYVYDQQKDKFTAIAISD